jgi:hypothetical protein
MEFYYKYCILACAALITQRQRDKANKQRLLLDNDSVNTYARNSRRTVFSMWSLPRTHSHLVGKAKPGTENIKDLNLAVVKLTTVQLTNLPL